MGGDSTCGGLPTALLLLLALPPMPLPLLLLLPDAAPMLLLPLLLLLPAILRRAMPSASLLTAHTAQPQRCSARIKTWRTMGQASTSRTRRLASVWRALDSAAAATAVGAPGTASPASGRGLPIPLPKSALLRALLRALLPAPLLLPPLRRLSKLVRLLPTGAGSARRAPLGLGSRVRMHQRNREPSPAPPDSAHIRPPMASHSRWQMARPSPLPPWRRVGEAST